MYNPKREVRECKNQVLEFDLEPRVITILKTKGISIGARKNHCAAAFKGSMVVYGGQSEGGIFAQDMIVFHMDTYEWIKINLKADKAITPFCQGTVVSVVSKRKDSSKEGL